MPAATTSKTRHQDLRLPHLPDPPSRLQPSTPPDMSGKRNEALKREAAQATAAYMIERDAHNKSKERIDSLEKALKQSKLMLKQAEEEIQRLVWMTKMKEVDEHSNIEQFGSYTDEEHLALTLPNVPNHPPNNIYEVLSPADSAKDGGTGDAVDDMMSPRNTRYDESSLIQDKSAEQNNDDTSTVPKQKGRIVVCIQCYRCNLRCDAGEPCQNCVRTNHSCKRAKCRNYKSGTCRRRQTCLRAHQEDEQRYKNIVFAGRVSKVAELKSKKKSGGRWPSKNNVQRPDDEDTDDGDEHARIGILA